MSLLDEFEVDVADLNEDALTLVDPRETAESLALAKAVEVSRRHTGALIIGGDTVVAVQSGGKWIQLGKPVDETEAFSMLSCLSGNEHIVITGISVVSPIGQRVASTTTKVTFRKLGSDEIEQYVSTGEPMDKAGAYAIQGGAAHFVESIEGPLDNVIGLPLESLQLLLAEVR